MLKLISLHPLLLPHRPVSTRTTARQSRHHCCPPACHRSQTISLPGRLRELDAIVVYRPTPVTTLPTTTFSTRRVLLSTVLLGRLVHRQPCSSTRKHSLRLSCLYPRQSYRKRYPGRLYTPSHLGTSLTPFLCKSKSYQNHERLRSRYCPRRPAHLGKAPLDPLRHPRRVPQSPRG